MESRRKKARRDIVHGLDAKFMRRHQLLHVCGFCSKIVYDSFEEQNDHVNSHSNETTVCSSCITFVRHKDTKEHIEKVHNNKQQNLSFSLNNSLVEIRIQLGKGFSNFWSPQMDHVSPKFMSRFRFLCQNQYEITKSARSLGIFRVLSQKFHWQCPICSEPSRIFPETIGMRAFALSHFEAQHLDEIRLNFPGFLETEWYQLQEETNFDLKSLMLLSELRRNTRERSYNTYYTVNLNKMTDGGHLHRLLMDKCAISDEMSRFCLVCCSLVPKSGLKKHFDSKFHEELNAISPSTAFTQVVTKSSAEEKLDENGVEEVDSEKKEEEYFRFPQELFAYSSAYKNLRQDMFKWRCSVCPHSHAIVFVTWIVMRLYALRHIDEHHRFLFTSEFLDFEWRSLKAEMFVSFDIRHYSPLQYTIRGEGTFNKTNPNDYVLPQQFYFLPKEAVADTLICGFCYRSLNRVEFLLHIVVHGFGVVSRNNCELKPVVYDRAAEELMGKLADEEELEDEPLHILSVEGKRLQNKMELVSSRCYSTVPGFSEVTTPAKSEIDGDGGGWTPRSRRTAVDARKLLSETFRILQDNARNRESLWNESSSSSSSDDENSEDEKLEVCLKRATTSYAERKKCRSKSKELEKKKPLTRMTPSEIRDWIRREAGQRGVEWRDTSSGDDSEDSDESPGNEEPEGVKGWSDLNLKDIKERIREAAKQKNITMALSSDDDSD